MARVLLRAYPSRFRVRYGQDIEADMRRALDAGRGRRVAVLLLIDTVVTLARAWWIEAWSWMVEVHGFVCEGVAREAVLALRAVRRAPGPAIVAVATLSLALGGNAAVFSVTHAVLMRSLPYDAPDRIVTVRPHPVSVQVVDNAVVLSISPVLEGASTVAGTTIVAEHARANLEGDGGAEQVAISQVSRSFFEVLGVRPLLGVGFDAESGASDVAVLSNALWRSSFGSDTRVVGRSIRLSGRTFRVAGVLPPEVDVPSGTDIWLPLPPILELYARVTDPGVLVRLRDGVSYAQATEELGRRARAEATERGDTLSADELPVVVPLREALTGSIRRPLFALWSASALVLLLGCVNVAGVMMSRLTVRGGELSVRAALGASRVRIFRLVFLDAAMPALLGGLGAAGVAAVVTRVLVAMLPAELPGLATAGLDSTAVAFLAGITVLAATLVGGLVAAQAAGRTRPDRLSVLRGPGHRTTRMQAMLSVAEVALAVVLAVTAGLLGRNLSALRAIPVGFNLERVLTFEVRLPESSHADAASWAAFGDALRERLASRPGVIAAGISGRLPLSDGLGIGLSIWREDATAEDAIAVSVQSATSQYFEAMGIPLRAGRLFADGATDTRSVVLGEAAATSAFGSADAAVGRRIHILRGGREPGLFTVVGVVAEIRQSGLLGGQTSQLYEPWSIRPVPWPGFALRAAPGHDSAGLAAAVRDAVTETHPAIAPIALRTTGEAAKQLLATERALALLSSVFGGFALVLAALGVYGAVSQVVALRRREMGIRLALGSPRRRIAGSVLRGALAIAVVGSMAGVAVALAGARLIESLLYGVSARDPLTFATAPAAALVIALLAALPAAARAAATDPLRSMRVE